MASLAKEQYLVLRVDDSVDDCLLIKRAIGSAERLHFIGSLSDGGELDDCFRGAGEDQEYECPDLWVVDLRNRCRENLRVLEWLQTQPFDGIVVVVLSERLAPSQLHPMRESDPGRRMALLQLLADYMQGRG